MLHICLVVLDRQTALPGAGDSIQVSSGWPAGGVKPQGSPGREGGTGKGGWETDPWDHGH